MTEPTDSTDSKAADAAKWAGVGVGIGSAALVAALLYANRDKLAQAVTRKPKPVEHED